MAKKTDKTSILFDLSLFSRGKERLLSELEKRLVSGKRLKTVFTPNSEQIVQSRENETFLSILQQADYLLPDSWGVVFASKFLALFGRTRPLETRVTGVSVVQELLHICDERGLKAMIIGGRGYTKGKALDFYGQELVWTPGYKKITHPTRGEETALRKQIRQTQPAVVFVAFGAPHQEEWVIKHHDFLEKNGVKIAMVVGGSFDYLLGKIKRAPSWLRRLGLEWLYRLFREPWRWRRQTRLLKFMWLTIQAGF